MTDKEFRKLSRSELIDIIYELRKSEAKLLAQLDDANRRLNERIVTEKDAGSIADAVIRLTGLFEVAQETADRYVESVKAECDGILSKLRAEAGITEEQDEK